MAIDIGAVDAAVISVVGEPLTYTPDGGGPTPIVGLFQDPDETPAALLVEITTSGPMVTCLRVEVPTPTKLDTLVRVKTGQNYQVKDFELDEGGLTILDLEETP